MQVNVKVCVDQVAGKAPIIIDSFYAWAYNYVVGKMVREKGAGVDHGNA